ncbi:MAG: pseudouridine synthase [Phycisphaerales bacterium]
MQPRKFKPSRGGPKSPPTPRRGPKGPYPGAGSGAPVPGKSGGRPRGPVRVVPGGAGPAAGFGASGSGQAERPGGRTPHGKPWRGPGSGGGGGPRKPAFGPRDQRGARPFAGPALPASVRVIHDDPDLIIVDKPPGLLTANIPGERRPALFDFLKRFVRAGAGGPPRGAKRLKLAPGDEPPPRWAAQGVYGIHRLDKEASGLLVFAKSEKAFAWLKQDFKTKRVHRVYTALVSGEIGAVGALGTIQSFLRETPSGRVESIATDAYRGAGRAAPGAGPDGQRPFDPSVAKLAVTHYRVIGTGKGLSLLQVRIDSGRKHQIRVHLADRGHPIVGDRRYGSAVDPLLRLCLHASELGFTHPGTGQSVRFNSAAPPAFYGAVGMDAPKRPEPAPAPTDSRVTPTRAMPAEARESPRVSAGDAAAAPARTPVADTSWEGVAGWYDAMQGDDAEGASDHYRDVIVPGVLRLVQPAPGQRVLDVACGQGILARACAAQGASITGIDASPTLIDAARERSPRNAGDMSFLVGDARNLESIALPGEEFDAAIAVMALGNIEPLAPVFRGIASRLRAGGRFVAVISHPAFRAPVQTDWHWDDATRTQFRRVSGYLSPGTHPIQMHPGKAAADLPGGEQVTWSFHRPLQHYARLLGDAGLLIETIEEWPSLRVSRPGPRAAEENRSRREIPLFLAWRAVRVGTETTRL